MSDVITICVLNQAEETYPGSGDYWGGDARFINLSASQCVRLINGDSFADVILSNNSGDDEPSDVRAELEVFNA